MREIAAETITEAIRDMCIEANYGLAPDMRKVFEKAVEEEESPLGRQVLGQLKENLKIAGEDKIPICQDTGMAVVFMKIGQDVHITGEDWPMLSMKAYVRDMNRDISVNLWLGIL